MDKRNNDKRMGGDKAISWDMAKRFVTGTPPSNKYGQAFASNSVVEFNGSKCKVVKTRHSRANGTTEFFFKKIY